MRAPIASPRIVALSGALWLALCDGNVGLRALEADAMLEKVALSGRFKVTESRVEVSFSLANRSTEDIYLIDVAFKATATGVEVRPDHLAVGFDPPGTVVLSSKLAALDPSAAWATPPVAYATRVKPGARYEAVLGARLPLRVEGLRPGGAPEPPAVSTREIVCTQLRFELGVVPYFADLQPREMTLAGREVCELRAAAWKHQSVEHIEGGGVSLKVTVPRQR